MPSDTPTADTSRRLLRPDSYTGQPHTTCGSQPAAGSSVLPLGGDRSSQHQPTVTQGPAEHDNQLTDLTIHSDDEENEEAEPWTHIPGPSDEDMSDSEDDSTFGTAVQYWRGPVMSTSWSLPAAAWVLSIKYGNPIKYDNGDCPKSENSQDTPLGNTTPANKRRVNWDPRLTPAKKGKQRIGDLVNTNMALSRAQTEPTTKTDGLQIQFSDLTLEMGVENAKVASQISAAALKDKRIQELETTIADQIALVAQRDAKVRDLEATTASLSQEQVRTISRMNNLQAQVSKLDLEMTAKNEELIARTTAASPKDEEIRRLAGTLVDLIRAQEKAKDDKADLQVRLELADGKIAKLEANLSARDRELYNAVAEIKHTRQTLETVTDSLSAEKNVNRTASLQVLLKSAEDELQAVSADLNDHRKNLETERSRNDTLANKVECLEEAQLRSPIEKEISDRKMKELVEMVSLNQDTIRDLQADAASRSTLLGQLQDDRTIYDAERACLLQQLMAESARSHCVKEVLPKSLAGVLGNTQDVQVFLGDQADETVLIRVQRFLNEQTAFIIFEKSDRTRTLWYESLDRCTAYTAEWDCYLRLKKGPEETTIEVRIHDIDSEVLEGWLKGAGPENAKP
ncbi:MAG: hypothetical protein Q9161_004340 [Pseudevernia consocians]